MLARLAFRPLLPAVLVAVLVACGSPNGTAMASPTASAALSAEPITKIAMARSVAKDGSAESPVTTFDSVTDQRLVKAESGRAPGTKLKAIGPAIGPYPSRFLQRHQLQQASTNTSRQK